MKNSCPAAIAIATAALFAAPLLAPVTGVAQAPAPANADDKAKAARAKRIAQQFEANARVLTVFDRQGKAVMTVGERAIYEEPVFSPDRTRLAVIMKDSENEQDLWVLDVATGNRTRITFSQKGEWVWMPVWSPDGNQLAYTASHGGFFGLYRKASNGEGTEELLYRHPGDWIFLTDWSLDGRFLSFFSSDSSSGGILYALPLGANEERKPIEVFRSESQVGGSRLSPNSRFLAYTSDQSGRNEVYVRPFDPAVGAGAALAAGPWQVSDQGAVSGQSNRAFWRQDGKELFYVAADRGVMAVAVSAAPTLAFGRPTLLFRLPEGVLDNREVASVSRDGERVVIALHPAPTLQQITVLDRRGSVLSTVGEPGRYRDPALSPDGTRVAIIRDDRRTGNRDTWTFDVASGQGTPVTNDAPPDAAPIWSPNGRQLAYVSTRGSFTSIYRKAWDGTGNEEQVFQYTPGATLVLTDWSVDGRFMTFYPGGGGVLMVMPLTGDRNALERKAIEWLREEYEVAQARLSPDSRFVGYLSDEIEAETFEVYARPFDASAPEAGARGAKAVRVSTAGALGMIVWRQDGKELYYLTPEWDVMAVDVTTTPTLQAGTPRLLFKVPGPLIGNPQQWKNVSGDGQRFVFTINVPASVTAR